MAEIDKLLAEAGEKIKKDAYAAGWRDALACISRSIADAGLPDSPEYLLDAEGAARSGEKVNNSEPKDGPKIGTTPYYVFQAVRKRPGMTGSEVILAVHADGHQVDEPGIRTALSRLGQRKLIVNRHKKWFAA